MAHEGGAFKLTELGPGVRLWKPEDDVLHDPNIVPQDEPCDEVLLGLPLGECGGVKMANQVIETISALTPGKPVYGNHEPTHGADSTAQYRAMGARFDLSPAEIPPGSPYVISAHGAAPSVHKAALEHGLRVLNVTCPLVEHTHRVIREANTSGNGHIAYISFGKPDHAELVGAAGLASERGIPFTVIHNKADVDALLAKVEDVRAITTLVGQTTNNSDEAGALARYLRYRFEERSLEVARSDQRDVCHTVRDRQKSTRDIVRSGVGALVVAGSTRSKNTESIAKVAADVAVDLGAAIDIYLTNSWGQIPELQGRVGVVSGASTREENVRGIVTRLTGIDSMQGEIQGVTWVGKDTDKGIVFSPIDPATRALLTPKRA